MTIAAYDDLTSLSSGEGENSLDFRFVKAYSAVIPVESNSMSPMSWMRVVSPDVIRFSPKREVVDKIKELTNGRVRLFQLPSSYGHEAGYYDIPASNNSKIFFEAIRLLQTSGSVICVPSELFKKTLKDLN